MKELSKTYSPSEFEDRIYKNWEEREYFTPAPDPAKKPFTIVIPPPNITGQLHMGHAMNNTYQDIIIRTKRMQGYAALWVPGTDHASIATEAKVVEAVKAEGLSKEKLGREGFLKKAWEWNEVYGSRIVGQLKKLGSSCDWTRQRFTLDEGCSKAVRKVFKQLYDEGLIYRGERIINWCTKCRTSISDIECEYEEQAGHFWHISYPSADGTFNLEIATTRPETLLGDTAVAVHPDDPRYQKYVGKELILPLTGRKIPIVADSYVDREFGTGCVKITPAHDPNDFEVGKRHNLPLIRIMDDGGVINENGGAYSGLERYTARKKIAADLDAQGLLIKVEDHAHNVGCCQRCGTTVEPIASTQWFVAMETLAPPAAKAVTDGDIKLLPKRFENNYLHWMNDCRDWCISRQLWWGHRIPAFYCAECGHITVTDSDNTTVKCEKCGGKTAQDEDTLDTWFSSALWPLSTLGYPDDTEDFRYFFPTSALVTGPDIIFFWVARMIFSSLKYTGQVPFKTVLFNGIVRDAGGKKMSKSSGNGVDPLEIIAEYGADALRMLLVSGTTPGNDVRWTAEKIKAYRNFANKLWNASRYVCLNVKDDYVSKELNIDSLKDADKWVLGKLQTAVREITDNIEKYEIGIAAGKIESFIWDVYCDWYIELTKPALAAGNTTAVTVLLHVLEKLLQLLHPFMPFITEEIWQTVAPEKGSIMVSRFPEFDARLSFVPETREFDKVIEAVSAVRAQRSELGVPFLKKNAIEIEVSAENSALFTSAKPYFEFLTGGDPVTVTTDSVETEGKIALATPFARLFIPRGDLVDSAKERERLEREKAACQKDIDFLNKKLGNAGFLNKAPAKQVEAEREKLRLAQEKMSKIKESLSKFG